MATKNNSLLSRCSRLFVILILCISPALNGIPTAARSIDISIAGSLGYEQVGHLGGSISAVAVQGQYAYLAMGDEFAVLDVSDPATLKRVSYLTFPVKLNGVALAGSYAYAVGEGVRAVNISDPVHPVETGHLLELDFFCNAQVAGHYLYLQRCYERSLLVLDLTDPGQPVFLSEVSNGDSGGGSCYNGDPSVDLQVVDEFAYLTDGGCDKGGGFGYLDIVDIHNPNSPFRVGELNFGGPGNMVEELKVVGAYAFVSTDGNGLHVIDVANPAQPKEVSLCPTCGNGAILERSGRTYLVGSSIIDITLPISPTIVAKCEPCSRRGIISGSLAYFPLDLSGLKVVDISDIMNTALAGHFNTVEPHFMATREHLAYMANNIAPYDVVPHGELAVYDMSNPENPTSLNDPASTPIGLLIDKIVLSGDYAYMTTEGLAIANISNPAQPELIGNYPTLWWFTGLAISDHSGVIHAYGTGSGGLSIIDLTDRLHPQQVSTFAGQGEMTDVALSGDYAYAVDSDYSQHWDLWVINVSNPSHPSLAGFCHGCGGNQIVISGNYAWVTTSVRPYGLKVIDINDPYHPIQKTFFPLNGYPKDLQIGCGLAYITMHDNNFPSDEPGLHILDIGDPLQISRIDYLPMREGAFRVALVDDLVDVIDVQPSYSGFSLQILRPLVSSTFNADQSGSLVYSGTHCLQTQLQVSPGTFAITTTLTYAPAAYGVQPFPGIAFTGHAFELRATQNGVAQPDLSFTNPITVSIQYQENDLRLVTDASEIGLYFWDGQVWTIAAAASKQEEDGGVIPVFRTQISKPGKYALFGPTLNLFLPVINR